MYRIEIDLEDWEWTALGQLALEREVDAAQMARKIVRKGLQERVGRVFDSLVLAGTGPNPDGILAEEAIEHRLGRLFEE